MNPIEVAKAYFDEWNSHDTDRINALFTADGTYSDPSVGGEIAGPALAQYVSGLVAAFPDLSFDITNLLQSGDQCVVGEWTMKGANTGSLMGLPPTGKNIALPGIDVIEVEGDKIRSVRGYFNGGTMLEQLDVNVIVQPKSVGPVTFGYSTYTNVGNKAKPRVIGVTQIRLSSPEQHEELRNYSRDILREISQMPGYIATATAFTWDGYATTVTAWEDMASAKNAVQGKSHSAAMKAMFARNGLGVSAWTSLWTDGQINTRWQRCEKCGNMAVVTSELKCKCGVPISEPPWF